MNAVPANQWKHTTAKDLYEVKEAEQKIAVYDDEQPGYLSLYYDDGKVRWPIRSVFLGDPEHVKKVLSAWRGKCEFIDRRNDQSTPLPEAWVPQLAETS